MVLTIKRYIKNSKNESKNEIIIDVKYLYVYEAIAASKEHIKAVLKFENLEIL